MATSDSPQTGIYTQQHGGRGTTQVFDNDGVLDITSGTLRLPPVHRQGYIPLNLFAGRAKTTASASGLAALSTGTQPSLANQGTTNNQWPVRIRWTSAAGATNQLLLPAIPIPPDYATAGGMTVKIVGQRASGQATGGGSGLFEIRAYAGWASTTGHANIGSTIDFTSSPAETTMALASGSVPATGFLTLALVPNPHASGSIDLYSGQIVYTKKTS